jgi:hypothetical protein
MTYVELIFGGRTYRGRLLEWRAPDVARAIEKLLPIRGRFAQDEWSGPCARMVEQLPIQVEPDVPRSGLQYAGLLVLDATMRQLALAFGQTRPFRTSVGPIPAVPIAEFVGDLEELGRAGTKLEFDGAQPFTIARAADQTTPLDRGPAKGRLMNVTLGDVTVPARLLEDTCPVIAPAFAALLPLDGFATNTHGSGPLTRFWNDKGGSEGIIDLPGVPDESPDPKHDLLIPGHLYYLQALPRVRGIRIPSRDATRMGGSQTPQVKLYPFARFEGDWTKFTERGARLRLDGRTPMRFELA